MIYKALNRTVLSQIPKTAKRLLDIGCGSGTLGRQIKKQNSNCSVSGITVSKQEKALASKYLDWVIVCDLNNFLPFRTRKI